LLLAEFNYLTRIKKIKLRIGCDIVIFENWFCVLFVEKDVVERIDGDSLDLSDLVDDRFVHLLFQLGAYVFHYN
jgi:hypothetical protein